MAVPASPDSQRSVYRTPPSPIPEILRTPPTPGLSISPTRRHLALLGREGLPDIAELAEPELRLAGIRINPRTSGPSRESFYRSLVVRDLEDGSERLIPLPAEIRISSPRWSYDGSHLAFVHTAAEGLELWVADIGRGEARRLTGAILNGTLGSPCAWLPEGRGLLLKCLPAGRGDAPAPPAVPLGPVVQETRGQPAPSRTYQDLLASPTDEDLFEHHFTAQLAHLALEGGEPERIGEPGIFSDFSPSPDGAYILAERIRRPYSYLVPWYRFPSLVEVWDRAGRVVHRVADLPLAEEVPIAFDAVPAGPRSFQWRADAPATLLWVETLDGGDPRVETAERERVLLHAAPFRDPPRTLLTLEHRFAGIVWGADDVALVYSRWWRTRWTRTYRVRPAEPGAPPSLLFDRSYEDRYRDPGSPVMTRNEAGQLVILLAPGRDALFLSGDGASPRGDFPFLDRLELGDGSTTRLWQCEDPFYEAVAAVLDPQGERVITRRESKELPPNYYMRNLRTGELRPLTDFPDPAPQLAGLQRRLITYPRSDGVTLSATLFTPPGYLPERDGPLPLLLWAYPREFLDADTAAQIDDSPNRFSRPGGASHLFLLTQGYAVLDGPGMPIIGAGEAEPNDTYVEQLVMGAAAAVEAVVEMGVASRDRIAVGGHSYGAAMTANLLAHSDLFRAGIARSGAYNRTLTPFGFQQEERTYWQAPEVYHRMSPFSVVDRIRAPLLLIHGEEDNNPGTYPLQTERFFHALKGQGATVRYVSLPFESHGYRAMQSVLHTLAEMVEWLDRYVKYGSSVVGRRSSVVGAADAVPARPPGDRRPTTDD
jgi:dipeptidyl aminopeptidase/acylaminoacyl peptidase